MVLRELDQCSATADSDPKASAAGRPDWRPMMKNSLNEEDFPLFTHRRRPIGERGSSLALRSGRQGLSPRLLLAAEMR
jgi:hypothetical protein